VSARALTEADLEALRAMLREEVRAAAEVIEARMRGQRVRSARRHRAPELAAQLAREVAGPAQADDVARSRAARAVAKLRGR
jgi:hypothetical protein